MSSVFFIVLIIFMIFPPFFFTFFDINREGERGSDPEQRGLTPDREEGITLEKKLMSVSDVAEYLGLHTDTIYNLVKKEKLPSIKIGGRILFLQHVLDDWLIENMK